MTNSEIKQHLAIVYLVSGKSTKDTAKVLDISESIIEKWRCKEDFKQKLREAIKEIYSAAIAKMSTTAVECAEELSRIATDSEVSDRVKISAIQLIFSQLEKARNWELEARLENIENILNVNQNQVTED